MCIRDRKERLESFSNPHFAGLNVNYLKIDEGFLTECIKYGLKLSVFTVDDEDFMVKYAKKIDGNITTNKPLKVREILEKQE